MMREFLEIGYPNRSSTAMETYPYMYIVNKIN